MAFVPNLPLQFRSISPSPLISRPHRCHGFRQVVPLCTLHQNQVEKDQRNAQTVPLQRYFDTFQWRGCNINYRVEGPSTGLPVLIVHGFGASINHWRKNIPPLVDTCRFRVFAIDLLGFGGSDKASPTEFEYGIPLWSELVCDFVNAMDPTQPWSFVGNSIGSLTVLSAATQLDNERVRAVALMNSAGGLVSFRYSELNIFQAFLLKAFNTVLFNRFTGPSLFTNFRKRENIANVLKQVYIDQTAISDDLLDILCDPSMDEGACDVFLAILNADAGPAPEPMLEKLNWCPMLVVWGEKDPWTPFKEGFHPGINFPKYHPGIDLHVIPNAGHCIHDECPEQVNELLVPFMLSPTLKDT